jgi:hypothetical protein
LHLVEAVDLAQPHLDALRRRGRQVLADVVRLDREFAMAAVDRSTSTISWMLRGRP